MATIKISLKHNPTTLYYTHSHSTLHCYYTLKKINQHIDHGVWI